MRIGITCCVLFTLLFVLFFSRIADAAVSVDVTYTAVKVGATSFVFALTMDYDRLNNILFITGNDESTLAKLYLNGTLSSFAYTYPNYPYGLAVNSTFFYYSITGSGIYSWDGSPGGASNIVIPNGGSGSDNVSAITSFSDTPKYMRMSPKTGDLFFTELSRVRRISSGYVYAFAGSGVSSSSGDGGPATSATFATTPKHIAITPEDELIIAEGSSLRKVYKNNTINTILSIADTKGLAVGDNGDIYVLDGNIIKKYRNGVLSTICGSGSTLVGSFDFTNTTNDASNIKLSYAGASDIVVGANNSIYFNSGKVVVRLEPRCTSGYALSSDHTVCYPICYGIVGVSQSVCSNNGTCTAPNTCSCNSGYTGSKCEIPICYGYQANDANVCSGNGTCISKDNCVCKTNYFGLACNITTCSSITSTNNNVCSSRGSCISYNTCKCSQNYYYGKDCQNTYCYSISSTDSNVCSGHGTCSDYNQCSCTSGWYGSYCNITECFSVLSNSSKVCSGAGTCISPNNCTCAAGYNGTNCENFDCFGVSVLSGQSACKNNGTCSGPGSCSCLPTYYGKTCDISTCYGILSNYSNVCSGHGSCQMLDTCLCSDNYYGKNCSFPICYGITYDNSSVCSARGKCTAGNTCACNSGYAGGNCQLNICYGVNSDQSTVCSSRGSCGAPNSCQCNSGYRGPNCQYVEMIMDAKTAVLSTAASSTLASYAPSTATSCSAIFSSKDLSYLGGSDTARCIWNQNMFKIYLGFRHFVYDNMTMDIVGNGMNFTLQIVLTKAIQDSSSSSSTSVMPQLAALPKASIILKSYSPPTFQAFRNTSLVWSCSGCSSDISTLLAAMNDKPVVVIPSSYMVTGTSFSLTVISKNWLGNTNTSSKVDIVYDSTSPYYFDFVSESSGSQFTCSGFDCIIEVNQYVGTGPLVSFASSFAALNSDSGDYLIRFLNRYSTSTILDSFYDGTMKIQPSSSTNALTYAMSYTSFEEVPIVLLNTEKQYYGNTLTVTASFIDPAIVYLSNSITYEWQCSLSSSKDGSYSAYDCSSSTTELIIPESKLLEGYHLFKVTVTLKNSKIVTTAKSATVQVVKTNIPDILFDAVPPVYPPSRSLVLNAVISSSTKIGSVTWQVTKGNLLYTNVLNQATNQALDGYNIKSTLVIDKSYLLQGDSYTFTVTASNDVGTGNASVSSVIDVAPRITCQAYSASTTSSVLYAYTSDVVVDCVSLSDYSIASYHVDVYTNSTRVMTVSKSMKKSFLTKLPYGPSGNVRLDIRAVNKIGSVSSTSIDLKVSLPNSDNTLSGRIKFANSEYESIKSTLTRLDSVPTMHSLLLLVIQQNSISEFADVDATSKTTLTTLITNMLTTLNNLKAISSNADDKLAPVFIPFSNDAYKLLAVVSSSTVASNTNLLGWVQFFVSSFNNVKSYYRSTLVSTIYDSKHLTEIESLIDIGSKYISADQFTPYYKETAIIARLINDVTNSTTTSSTIVDSSGSETRFDFVDRIQQLNSKTITFTNYPSISITFPSDFYTQLGYSNTGSGVTLTSSVSTTKYSQSLSPVVDISLSTSSGSAISVSGLQSNLIQINYGSLTQSKANYTSLNYSCRFLNTSSSQWSLSGVSSSVSVLSDDGQTVTFSLACSTSHLTAFGVLSAAIPKTSQSKSVTTDNTGVIVGAVLGTLLPLILIAIIVVVVVIIIVILYKRKQSIDTSKVQDVELVNKNVSSVYISDFPSEESTHFKQLVSVSSGSTSTDPLSRYIDMVKIGQGAFGSVFKGADTKQGGKLKAIKVIRFNSVGELNNMLKEGTMLMNIDHPHILKVNEFIIDKDNILCIDTDFCEDGDLTKLTLSPEPIPEPIIKQVIYQMCSALSFIHTKLKIIHRDVKPHNIFLKELTDFSVQTVLADFGLAKQDQNNSMNSYAGTPLYMSPELALGGKYNYNTDTWSLGVVAYQLMTKDITTALSHLCLTGDSADTRNKIKAKLDGAGEYSEALKEVVLTMLEKDAASRPYPQELIDRPFFQDYRPKKKKNNIFRSSSAGEEDMYM